MVLGRELHTDAKTDVKNYQGPLLPQKMRIENSIHPILLTSIIF
jgi:hypothetical protein